MWIMTTAGYVSIVAKGGKDVLMVRSRDLESLKVFCIQTNRDPSDIITGVGTDYPHRLYSNKFEVEKFLLAEMEYLQYPNFKTEAKLVRGPEFAEFLSRCWTASLDLEDVPFQKWTLSKAGGLDWEGYDDWEELVSEKHLTAKKELGYAEGPKHRKEKRNRKGSKK